jgi:hypothetical protein
MALKSRKSAPPNAILTNNEWDLSRPADAEVFRLQVQGQKFFFKILKILVDNLYKCTILELYICKIHL